MAKSEEDSPRKPIRHARKQGLTVHYMSKRELRDAVNGFRGWKQTIEESRTALQGSNEGASETNNSPELERLVKEQTKTISDLKDALRDTKKRHESAMMDADHLALTRLMDTIQRDELLKERDERIKVLEAQLESQKSDIGAFSEESRKDKESINSLEQSIRSKEEQLQTIEKAAEESERVHKHQLEESKASYAQLLAEFANLQDQMESLRTSSWVDIKLLNESLDAAKEAAEESDREHKELMASMNEAANALQTEVNKSKAAYDKMQAEHTAEVEALEEEARQAKRDTEALADANQSLEKSIQALKEESEEFGREHKVRLDQSQEVCDQLLAKQTALESECKNLEGVIKLKDEEMQSFREEQRKFVAGLDSSMKDMQEKNLSLQRGYEKQMASMNGLMNSLKEKVELNEKDKASKERAIEQLRTSNEEQLNQINEKTNKCDSLQCEVQSLEQKIQLMKANEEAIFGLHKKDAAAQKAVSDKMKTKIEELTEDINSQKMVTESLHGQLNEGLKCKTAMQQRIAFLEKKLEQVQAVSSPITKMAGHKSSTGESNNNIESSEIDTTEDEVIDLLSSNEDNRDHECDAAARTPTTKRNGSKPPTVDTASTEIAGIQASSDAANNAGQSDTLSDRGSSKAPTAPNTTVCDETATIQENSDVANKAGQSTAFSSDLWDGCSPNGNCSRHGSPSLMAPAPGTHTDGANVSKPAAIEKLGNKESQVPTWNTSLDDGGHSSKSENTQNRSSLSNLSAPSPATSELESEHFQRDPERNNEDRNVESEAAGQKLSQQVSFDADKDADTKAEVSSHPVSGQKEGMEVVDLTAETSSKRIQRKRKVPDLFTPSTKEERAQRLNAPKDRPAQPKRGRKSRKSVTRRLQDSQREAKAVSTKYSVGWKFRKWFPAPYNQWYDGEVIEILGRSSSSRYLRRCRYTDGSIEDYTLQEMKQHCKLRS